MSTPAISVTVQEQVFDVAALQRQLLPEGAQAGAVAAFTGYVRGSNEGGVLNWMELEHYPGMTEASLEAIAERACERWTLLALGIVHRVGRLEPGDPIVWVGAASPHRAEAFAACDFVMDYLKTQAPFWKRENGAGGERWVEARDSDNQRADRWR